MRLALPIASYSDPPSSSTQLVNAYIEQGGDQGMGPVLQGAPGIEDFVFVTSSIASSLVISSVELVQVGATTTYQRKITTSGSHGLSAGNSVVISGVTGTKYYPGVNGTWTISSVASVTEFYISSITVSGPAGSYSGGGTIPTIYMTSGNVRACFQMLGVIYVVCGDKFYKVVGTTVTLLGTIGFGARPQIAGNGIQVCVLVSPNAYVYTLSTGVLSQITDADFTARGASSVQFFDNFLTFTEPNSGRWFSSDLTDATAFNSLNFATAEGAPDNLLTHVVDHRQAFLLGTESCELWDNAGIAGFPFIRAANGFVEIGCLAKDTAVKVDQSVIWLASDGTVRRLQGVTPVRVSTHAVERAIRSYTVSGAYGLTVTWDGHLWYVLTFPENTWVYDVTTQKWFERRSYGYDNWRVSCSAQLDGVTYVGDAYSNKLGVMADVFTEWDDVLRMAWTYPAVYADGRRAIHNRLEIKFESGVGIASGQGSDPYVSLEVSDDSKTFREMPIKRLGKIGEYRNRAVWHRLGQSRDRVYRAYVSDPIRRKVVDTQLEVEGGRL